MELNDQQRRAAAHRDGPLKVLAGPGSGKTLVIVEKVIRLVKSGVPEESILCMTFTEKAADVMRQRLYGSGIRNIWVGTMHALCLEVLKENGVTTGITDRTVVFSEMARLAWCVRNIHNMGMDAVNLEGDTRDTCAKMLKAVRLAKRELVSADTLRECAGPGAPTDAASGKLLADLAKLYDAYESHKRAMDLVDYEDMVALAVQYLKENPSMLEKYARQYRYVLVDEFQDNNYAQFLLMRLLSPSGNVTVVGDDDQSIMGFQGAFGGIFQEFDAAHSGSESVILDTNHRCSANISNISSKMLEADPDRTPKRMRAHNPDGRPVTVVAADDEAAERQFVAETILDRNVPFQDVAVLCRTNHSCQEFVEALRARDIPATLVSPGSLARNATIAEVVALLRIADSPETSGTEISHILKTRGIREYNIRAINVEARRRSRAGPATSDDCVFSTLGMGLELDQDTQIREIWLHLREMADAARSGDLLDTLYGIMSQYSDAYGKNANGSGPDAARNLALLNHLYRMAQDYIRHYPRERLSDFIDYMEIVDDPAADSMDTEDVVAGDAVRVMTIHKSKGREFGTVFVTGLYDDNVPGKYRHDDFEIPVTLLKGVGRERDPEAAHLREMRNLLYVAMTRAKDKLYLTYPLRAKNARKERVPSRFLANVGGDPRVHTVQYLEPVRQSPVPRNPLDVAVERVQEETCRAVRESRVQAAVRGVVELAHILHARRGEDGDFDPRHVLDVDPATRQDPPPNRPTPLVNKDTLTLSATDIDTYMLCPLKLKYRKILGIPEKPSIHLNRGAAIHDALEWAAKERLDGRSPDVAKASEIAREELERARHAFPEHDYQKAESSIGDILERYAEWEGDSQNKLVGAEVKFETMINGITYRGKMDRVETNPDGAYEIVDFKTGSSVVAKGKVRELPQANIYAAAAREKYGSLPAKFSLVYLAKRASREYDITEESLEAGLDIARGCAADIVEERFDPTPGYHCKWCSYRLFCPATAPE